MIHRFFCFATRNYNGARTSSPAAGGRRCWSGVPVGVYCFLSDRTSDTLLYNCRFPTLLEGYAQSRSLSKSYLFQQGCAWRCRARQTGEDLLVLSIINVEYTCIGRGLRKHASASKKEWLDPVVSRHLNVTKKTTLMEIKDLLRVRFAEEISYKIAKLCRLCLLDGDIGA